MRAERLLLQLFQVDVDGVEFGLGSRDGQVTAVPRQAHAPAGAGQVQLTVIDRGLLELEVHHVGRLAHVHQQVPEDAAQEDAEQLPRAHETLISILLHIQYLRYQFIKAELGINGISVFNKMHIIV